MLYMYIPNWTCANHVLFHLPSSFLFSYVTTTWAVWYTMQDGLFPKRGPVLEVPGGVFGSKKQKELWPDVGFMRFEQGC